MKRPSSLLAFLLLPVSIALSAVPAWADPATCALDPLSGILTVTMSTDGDSATLARSGDQILLNGAACEGATTSFTELIQVLDLSGGSTTLTVDLSGGPFAPGRVDEAGDSDEIEIDADLGGGDGDVIAISGSGADDHLVLGSLGANLNPDEADGLDADLSSAGADSWVLQGFGGNDRLSAWGSPETGGPLAQGVLLDAGNGADTLLGGTGADTFNGGDGFDTADYEARSQDLTITVGAGANDGASGEADDVQGTVESVSTGSANDTVTGDGSSELLIGGAGNDRLTGGNGADELRGLAGTDTVDGGANDDLLVGGEGNDTELGGGYNDVFSQNPAAEYRSTGGPVAIPDTGAATSTVDVSGAGAQVWDVNVRLDIEHPDTRHLTVALTTPWGASLLLSQKRGNGTPMLGTVFDADEAKPIQSAGALGFDHRFRPEDSLADLEGGNPNGTWQLSISDDTAGTGGSLNAWALEITSGVSAHDGADILKGQTGEDLVDYAGRLEPLVVTMATGANDGQAGETDNVGGGVADIELLTGGEGADDLTAPALGVQIRGRLGADTITGAGGGDSLFGNDGNDQLDGADGTDTTDGGTGTDTCLNAETKVSCELPQDPVTPVTCALDVPTGVLTVTMSNAGNAATLLRSGNQILLNGGSCDGATVTSTELIRVLDVSAGATALTVDLAGGALAPGVADELGDSDEIEIEADLGAGSGDVIAVSGTGADDHLLVGSLGANLNPGEADGLDPDLTGTGIESWTLRGLGGSDRLSAWGSPETGGPLAQGVLLDGGNGADTLLGGTGPDTFNGGEGFDTADYEARSDDLTITMGAGANDGTPGEADDVQASMESASMGSGNDTATGSASSNLLIGGPGNDILSGGDGDDELRGLAGNDTIQGQSHDDLHVGGQGDDTELGEGYNDVFSQNQAVDHRSSGAPVPIPDVGVASSSFQIASAPTRMYDVNVRVDIEHAKTQQLQVMLVSPWGSRTRMIADVGNGTQMRGTVFDSEAVKHVGSLGSWPLDGRFHPAHSLEGMRGQLAPGTWTLEVRDKASGSSGRINWWQLQVSYGTFAGDGADTINGGSGLRDLVDYSGRFSALTATLEGGADDGQAGEGDNIGAGLDEIEDTYGGFGPDTLTGTSIGKNELRGSGGDDTISGLQNDDVLRGQDGNDELYGGDGFDLIYGHKGNDLIDGGTGTDWVTYAGSTGAVNVNLATGTSSGAEDVDSITGIENLRGSPHGDTLRGTDLGNFIEAREGNDTVFGLAGNDRLDGGAGTDNLDGGLGTDTCLLGETKTSCEA